MSTGGLSKVRLGRMHEVMAGYVERGEVPGLVTLVSRRGEAHVEAIGTKALGGSDPIRPDTIFRISSMTKPITAAATMILWTNAGLRLDDPVDRLLPELADRKVLKRLDGPALIRLSRFHDEPWPLARARSTRASWSRSPSASRTCVPASSSL